VKLLSGMARPKLGLVIKQLPHSAFELPSVKRRAHNINNHICLLITESNLSCSVAYREKSPQSKHIIANTIAAPSASPNTQDGTSIPALHNL